LALATIEISDVQESELFADSVESNMNGLESIMFGEEISSEGSSVNNTQVVTILADPFKYFILLG